LIAFDNGDDGFRAFTFPGLRDCGKYAADSSEQFCSRPVVFGEGGDILIGGGEQGRAIVYDKVSMKQLQSLSHKRGKLVQALAVGVT
jgi:hypothetical protein